MTEISITDAGRYSIDGVEVVFDRGVCSNPEYTKAMLSVTSPRGIYCVLIRCAVTNSVIAHETYNGIKSPQPIAFLESEEHGPYIVEVS